jgi:hypothetical protein
VPAAVLASLRRQRNWLIALTVAVVLIALSLVVFPVAFLVFGLGGMMGYGGEPSIRVDEVRQQVQAEWGTRIEDLQVRSIELEFDGSGPGFLGGLPSERAVYVEARLKQPALVIAEVIGPAVAFDVASSGLLPSQAPLTSRLSQAQLRKLLSAYQAQTQAPVGGISRYTEQSYMRPPQVQVESVRVKGRRYKLDELWMVREGILVEGERLSMERMAGPGRLAHVFWENPRSGAFEYVAAEPTQLW